MKQLLRISAITIASIVLVLASSIPARAQSKSPIPKAPGQEVFEKTCANCHTGANRADRAPDLNALMLLNPETVLAAVTTGDMAVPAQKLTDEEKRAIAEYLGGRPLDPSNAGSAETMPNRCAGSPEFAAAPTSASWNGWGINHENTRYADAKLAGLTANEVPRLKLKWAFGVPHGDTAFGQPAVVGGRIFFGSDIGYFYSLNAVSGCIYWSYHAKAGVRTAPTVAAIMGLGSAVYFGDLRGNVYAVNAATGKELWTRKITDHYSARITGAPALYDGLLYVPVSAMEEAFSADPLYPCCTFRGNVVALDANTGEPVWKTYVIPEEPKPVSKNSKGTQLYAPAGAAVWNSPTIDPQQHALYVGTGDAFTEPAAKTSDAVVALDLKTGEILWSFQAVQNDAFMVGCVPVSTENCPKDLGPDHDFGSSPILLNLAGGHRILLATPKSGDVFALDPDRKGAVLWKLSLSEKVAPNNGQIAFGGATDSKDLYLALEDGTFAAVHIANGSRSWLTRLESLEDLGEPTPNGENRTKAGLRFGQSAAVTEIPGAVFTGGWDGILRALSTKDGKVIWQFNTVQDFKTVNGVSAKGGSMGGPGVVTVNGMVYVGSGYANVGGGMPGNVLLAFSAK